MDSTITFNPINRSIDTQENKIQKPDFWSTFNNKILTDSSLKKIFHILRKGIFAADLYTGTKNLPGTVSGLKTAGEILDVYAVAKDLREWYEYFTTSFSCKTVDQALLSESLKKILRDNGLDKNVERQKLNEHVEQIVKDFVDEEEDFKNIDGARVKLYDVISKHISIESEEDAKVVINRIAYEAKIKQKSYSTTLFFAKVCASVADIGDVALTLNKWGVFRYANLAAQEIGKTTVFKKGVVVVSHCALQITSKAPGLNQAVMKVSVYAVQIGTNVPVFKHAVGFVVKFGVETTLGVVGCVALAGFLAVDFYKLGAALHLYLDKEATEAEKLTAKKNIKAASLSALSTSVNLVCTAVPLMITLNPFLGVVVVHVIAKGTSLGVAYIKPK